MKTLVGMIIALLIGGCASTEPYFKPATAPMEITVKEVGVGSGWGKTLDSQITKRVQVSNPFDKNVWVFVDCGLDSEWQLVIGSGRTQNILVMSTVKDEYNNVCSIRDDWRFTDEKATN